MLHTRAGRPVSQPPRRRRVSLVWLVPVVALAVGGILAIRTLAQRGPEVTIAFKAAAGISAGTKVLHKSVELGAVTAVVLAADMSHVDAIIRMSRDAKPLLTQNARFWVVRPELSGGTVSGLNTLFSGSYIDIDPGTKGGPTQTRFVGLEQPPGVRSDQPGTTYMLHAPTIASLNSGTPVFYRDVVVGEVLGNRIPEGTEAITGDVFVRAPYDKRVRTGSVWWQYSGVATSWEANGVSLAVPSTQAVLSGGVAFNEPPDAPDYPLAGGGTVFPLFPDEESATRASYRDRIPYVIYLHTAASGLAAGSPVQLYGLQVGDVKTVEIQAPDILPRVRVTIDVLPASVTMIGGSPMAGAVALGRDLVTRGMRASLITTSYVTGAQAVSLDFLPERPKIEPATENGLVVLPALGDDASGSILGSAAGLLERMRGVQFQALGDGISSALGALAAVLSGFDPGKQAVGVLAMVNQSRAVIARLDASLGPVLQALPGQADALQAQLQRANQALAGADLEFGSGSGLGGRLAAKVAGYYDTVRYVRLLADYLARHPEAIARGATANGSER